MFQTVLTVGTKAHKNWACRRTSLGGLLTVVGTRIPLLNPMDDHHVAIIIIDPVDESVVATARRTETTEHTDQSCVGPLRVEPEP